MTHTDPDKRSKRQGERYRAAAEESLQQLKWCVDYLYKIRKPGLARAIARNCDTIEERLSDPRPPARPRPGSARRRRR